MNEQEYKDELATLKDRLETLLDPEITLVAVPVYDDIYPKILVYSVTPTGGLKECLAQIAAEDHLVDIFPGIPDDGKTFTARLPLDPDTKGPWDPFASATGPEGLVVNVYQTLSKGCTCTYWYGLEPNINLDLEVVVGDEVVFDVRGLQTPREEETIYELIVRAIKAGEITIEGIAWDFELKAPEPPLVYGRVAPYVREVGPDGVSVDVHTVTGLTSDGEAVEGLYSWEHGVQVYGSIDRLNPETFFYITDLGKTPDDGRGDAEILVEAIQAGKLTNEGVLVAPNA